MPVVLILNVCFLDGFEENGNTYIPLTRNTVQELNYQIENVIEKSTSLAQVIAINFAMHSVLIGSVQLFTLTSDSY